jgi:hypothetical protein
MICVAMACDAAHGAAVEKRSAWPMKIKIGRFFLGHESVDVFACPSETASTARTPGNWLTGDKLEVGELNVAAHYSLSWSEVLEGLWHEAIEYLMVRRQCRFKHDQRVASNDSSTCLFVLDHSDFTEIIAALSEFHPAVVNKLSICFRHERAKNRKKKAAAKAAVPLVAKKKPRKNTARRIKDRSA